MERVDTFGEDVEVPLKGLAGHSLCQGLKPGDLIVGEVEQAAAVSDL